MARAFFTVILWLCFILPTFAVGPELKQTTWVELTPAQKEILAPLASEWDSLEPFRKKKWLGVAKRYPKMTPEQQQRIQSRMRDWVKLTPEQRRQAREKYRTLKQMPPEKRREIKQKWREYERLQKKQKNAGREGAPASESAGAQQSASTPGPRSGSLAPAGAAQAPESTPARP